MSAKPVSKTFCEKLLSLFVNCNHVIAHSFHQKIKEFFEIFNILIFLWIFNILCLIRLVIYCRNLQSNLHRNYGVEFYLAKLLISSRNRGVECTWNVDRIQVPTVDDQP